MINPNPPAGRTIYEEKRFSLRECQLELRDNHLENRAVVLHHGSVVILPIDNDGRVILIENQRWQIGSRILELPAGTMERGEDPLVCASRELLEETGYQADQLDHFQSFFALPGLTTEVMHVYIARDLKWVGQSLEADEDILVRPMPLDDVRALVVKRQIIDAKTLAILASFLLSQADVEEPSQ